MSDVVRRNFALKMQLNTEEKQFMDALFKEYAQGLRIVLKYLKRLYDEYEKLEIPKENKECFKCKEEGKIIWKSRIKQEEICSKCYNYLFNYMRLTTRSSGMLGILEKQWDKKVHGGYPSGQIKLGCQIFKSWITKKDDRAREIQQLKLNLKATTDIKKQLILQKILLKKEQGIKDIEFCGEIVYLGNAGMFEFRENNGHYEVGIKHPYEKKIKLWYPLLIGKEESYKTDHNKYDAIKRCIEQNESKTLFGKIKKREEDYEFMFPQKNITNSLMTNPEIIKLLKENKDIPIVTLSFGIIRPVTIVILKDKKIKTIKTFGNKSLWHWINRERAYRSKVMRIFAKRYSGKWMRNKKRKKFYLKRGDYERNYIKYNTHLITTRAIKYIIKYCPNSIIVFQDIKGIKRINYPDIYKVVLSRWNVAMQKQFLEYKAQLHNIHLYIMPYKTANVLTCQKCQNKIFDKDKKELKTLTIKLLHGMHKKAILLEKKQASERKIKKLLTIKNEKRNAWLIEESSKLTQIKNALSEEEKKNLYKRIECSSCKYNEDFYINNCFQLYSQLLYAARGDAEASS